MPRKTIEEEVDAKPARAEGAPAAEAARRDSGLLIRVCVAGWLVPGLGHLLLGRKWRALILFAAIVAMFLLGLGMKGEFFWNHSGSYLETLGYFGVWCVGLARWAAAFFQYPGGDPFFPSADYGTAFLVAAGMLNVLAILDAYDIAVGRKK